MRWDIVAIIGVGLLGGSIGLALRKRKLAKDIVGIGRRRSTLAKAQEFKCVTRTTTSIARGVAEADLVVVCTPVDLIAQHVAEAAACCPPRTILTDVGSTKAEVVAAAEAALLALENSEGGGPRFVGSHPIAGSEKTGCEASRPDLFEGCVTIVTPTAKTDAEAAAKIDAFWTSLGASLKHMPPDAHDAAVARTSHLPHLVASALAAATPGGLVSLTAGGWRDTTRVAAGDPELWRQILLSNAGHTLSALADFERVLEQFRSALQAGDGKPLAELLQHGKTCRDAVGNRHPSG
jgi:prephenate dehydrogenase